MNNVKNYFEQGGNDLVIGGKITFEEGAEVVGFPAGSAPDIYVLDMSRMITVAAESMGLDISSCFSVEEFQNVVNSHTPLLLKNVMLNGYNADILLNLSHAGDRFVGLVGLIGNMDGEVRTIATVLVYRDGDSVVRLRINYNSRLQTLLNDE